MKMPKDNCNHDFHREVEDPELTSRYYCSKCDGIISEQAFEMFLQGFQLGRRGAEFIAPNERH